MIDLPAGLLDDGWVAKSSDLIGREAELEHLESELRCVRTGASRVIVLVGEAGIGKSVLLDHVRARMGTARVLRVSGVESELELDFAGLHQLCGPLLDEMDRLPTVMRRALRTTFGLEEGPLPDPLLVALAVLHLVSERAGSDLLLCMIDDAQWLDRASLRTLAFVARRLRAESVLMIFASRSPCDELTGLPARDVTRLADTDAHELLSRAVSVRLDEQVRARIVAEARGNPLALLELPHGLSLAEISAGFVMPTTEHSLSPAERVLTQRIQQLPPATRLLLVVAAAEPVGDTAHVWRAAERLKIPADAADPATAAGLVELGVQTTFRHPLVRTVAYRTAPSADRRAAHGALADATAPGSDPDRRAWHRAQSSSGPHELVADELERSAGRAQARGGFAAAAAFFERSAALTPSAFARSVRALRAAQAAHQAGSSRMARRLLVAAQSGPLDELRRAQSEVLHSQLRYAERHGDDAPRLLLRAAQRLEPLDVGQARATYIDALVSAQHAGRTLSEGVRRTAEAARCAPRPVVPGLASDLLLDGLAEVHSRGYASGAPVLRQAVTRFLRDEATGAETTQWAWVACRSAIDLWDYEACTSLADRIVRDARAAGALTMLPLGLTLQAASRVFVGDLDGVARLSSDAASLAQATGSHLSDYGTLQLSAWRGRETEGLAAIEAIETDAKGRGEGQAIAAGFMARAVLFNGLGHYDRAMAAAEQGSMFPEDLYFYNQSLIELVESAVRLGQHDQAVEAMDLLAGRTGPAGTAWAAALEARSRALISEGDEAEHLYGQSLRLLARSDLGPDLARSHLLYGEWLRRERRLSEAREHLRKAHRALNDMGLEAFADRAATELRAAGGRPRQGPAATPAQLTSQELRIAQIVATGATNKEVATELFLSPRTVDAHLRSIFSKLDIASRRQLRAVPGLAGTPDMVGAT